MAFARTPRWRSCIKSPQPPGPRPGGASTCARLPSARGLAPGRRARPSARAKLAASHLRGLHVRLQRLAPGHAFVTTGRPKARYSATFMGTWKLLPGLSAQAERSTSQALGPRPRLRGTASRRKRTCLPRPVARALNRCKSGPPPATTRSRRRPPLQPGAHGFQQHLQLAGDIQVGGKAQQRPIQKPLLFAPGLDLAFIALPVIGGEGRVDALRQVQDPRFAQARSDQGLAQGGWWVLAK